MSFYPSVYLCIFLPFNQSPHRGEGQDKQIGELGQKSLRTDIVLQTKLECCPHGPTDKASAYGAEDSEFESLWGYVPFLK